MYSSIVGVLRVDGCVFACDVAFVCAMLLTSPGYGNRLPFGACPPREPGNPLADKGIGA